MSFGDAIQVFNIGPASVGSYGVAAGICEASARFGTMALADLVGPAATLARDGVELNRQQAYIAEILAGIVTSTPESRALFAPEGVLLRAGERIYQPELAESLERLATEGAAPFYTGSIGRRSRTGCVRAAVCSPARTWATTVSSTTSRCACPTADVTC